jgi:hypothetical protein
MIVRVELKNTDNTICTSMFGDSYKKWSTQFSEYCRIYRPIELISLNSSKSEWIGWGGLKWCDESEFQNELNREGCQSDEPDNPNPSLYSNMIFGSNPIAENIARKIIKQNKI